MNGLEEHYDSSSLSFVHRQLKAESFLLWLLLANNYSGPFEDFCFMSETRRKTKTVHRQRTLDQRKVFFFSKRMIEYAKNSHSQP